MSPESVLLPSAQYRPEDCTPVLVTAANKTVERYLLQLALKTEFHFSDIRLSMLFQRAHDAPQF